MDSAEPTTPAIFKGGPKPIPWEKRIPWIEISGAVIGTMLGQTVVYFLIGYFNPIIAASGIVGQTIWSYLILKKELEDEQRKSI